MVLLPQPGLVPVLFGHIQKSHFWRQGGAGQDQEDQGRHEVLHPAGGSRRDSGLRPVVQAGGDGSEIDFRGADPCFR